MDLATQTDLACHGLRAAAQLCRRQDISGFVHKRPCEVLALSQDDALIEASLGVGAILFLPFVEEQGECVDALVLAIRTIGIDVKVCDQGTFE